MCLTQPSLQNELRVHMRVSHNEYGLEMFFHDKYQMVKN
jgi:hypothetical protein